MGRGITHLTDEHYEYINFCLPHLIGERKERIHVNYGKIIMYGNYILFHREPHSETKYRVWVNIFFPHLLKNLFHLHEHFNIRVILKYYFMLELSFMDIDRTQKIIKEIWNYNK